MERRLTNNVWIIGYRETDFIHPDALQKVSLILGGVLIVSAILVLGLWTVVPNF